MRRKRRKNKKYENTSRSKVNTPVKEENMHYSNERISVLAKKYNVTENTIRKWKRRTDFEDRSSRRKKICFTLNEFQEALICELRKTNTLFYLQSTECHSLTK